MKEKLRDVIKKINTEIDLACFNGDSKIEIILETLDMEDFKKIKMLFVNKGFNVIVREDRLEIGW